MSYIFSASFRGMTKHQLGIFSLARNKMCLYFKQKEGGKVFFIFYFLKDIGLTELVGN